MFSMFYSDFGSASPLFSGCTPSWLFYQDVHLENIGEVLPKF
jgi:hypothetical protein